SKKKILEELSFWEIKDSLISTPLKYLSAGERKKTALANIFLSPTPLILLDEPTANLDNLSKKKLINKITNLLQSKSPCAMIIASHDKFSFNSLNTKILQL
ncbi:MAG: ATP-binding cassette domain-containing protein, partial [Candidatus Dadabacteria bacterium]